MSFDVTIEDKHRPENMLPQPDKPGFLHFKDRDEKIKRSLAPDRPGVYIVQIQLRGRILLQPLSRLEVRHERYPFDAADNGTAWHPISLKDPAVEPGIWFDTMLGKIVIAPPGAQKSTSAGMSYQFRGGALECFSRVVKFIYIHD